METASDVFDKYWGVGWIARTYRFLLELLLMGSLLNRASTRTASFLQTQTYRVCQRASFSSSLVCSASKGSISGTLSLLASLHACNARSRRRFDCKTFRVTAVDDIPGDMRRV